MQAGQGVQVVNEPTVDVAEPISKTGGEGITSFDELESLHEYKKEQEAPKKEAKEGKKDEAKSEDPEESPKDQKAKGDKEKADQVKEKVKDTSQKPKVYKVKVGDKDIEIPSDVGLEVTVAGKKESVPLQEIINNYAGKADWSRKYSELDKERKSFHNERQTLQQGIDYIYKKAVEESDPLAAFDYLVESLGGDPLAIREKIQTDWEKQFEDLAKLSPEERQLAKAQKKAEYLENKLKSDKETKTTQAALSELKDKTDQTVQSLGIEMAEFVKAYDEMKAKGQDPQGPEEVAKWYKEGRMAKDIMEIFDSNGLEVGDGNKNALELYKVWQQNPAFSREDVLEIANEVYGSKAAKALSKKLEKSKPTDTARPEESRRKSPITFDDLEETI